MSTIILLPSDFIQDYEAPFMGRLLDPNLDEHKYIFIKTEPDLERTPGKVLTLDPLAVQHLSN